MKRVFLWMVVALLVPSKPSRAQQDTAEYRAASSIQIPAERLRALEQFTKQYPESGLATKAYDGLFEAYIEQGNETASVDVATRSLGTLPPDSRVSAYNRFAYALATKNMGLDSALAWSSRAVDIGQATRSRSLSGFQDTRAYVLFRQGRFADAERLQRIAIQGHEDDPEYLGHLALYEKENGKLRDALRTMSRALYFGADSESKEHFLNWIALAEEQKPSREKLKQSVVMTTIHGFIDTLKGAKLVAARSNAAALMADLGVDLSLAAQWADPAVRTMNKNSSIEERGSFEQNLALVLTAQGKHREALARLRSIEDIVDPYDARFWRMLGGAYERAGDTRKAIGAYMQGLVPRNDKQLRILLDAVYAKEHESPGDIDRALDSVKQSNARFDPGSYGKLSTPGGKVILAELFTGAECGPCVGADLAFDALAEYYPKTTLAILEYHVHIPGPDPLTNNDSWGRHNSYEGGGTPTVIIDGREKIVGGGSKFTARNRFGVYRHAIGKYELERPAVILTLALNTMQDTIDVNVKVGRNGSSRRGMTPALHLALVERSVDYTGANGISKHAFVVRRLFDGVSGTAVSVKPDGETITRQINVTDVEKSIKEYLDNPTVQPSWSSRRPFNGWRARPEKLNRSNLAIIAWVQDTKTREVFQAVYQEIPAPTGMK